ncbi:hypothetical protein J7E79_27675 [Bacillus sp. ISL-40]|uniref:hypothetical protein n=1 Tax=unclassified Bacillus (in: firmicutes) TaxID=185979 RepID=UPI001BEB03BC|nr:MULTISPECIES: hypothetical protein [unclassified Bacillus (in: firmicutes)]MBT2701072.1 hypothetical protein [Bacillus sp. ISL-40]MBT2741019.1 hypothetical protein [Bacillus sp. ISL-77]
MNNKNNWFYISLTVISIIVLILEKAGPFADKLRFVGFALFTIFCVAMIIENKDSKGKRIGAILYFLLGLVVLLN